jgi:tetratricopeptide (TPR) repeat protein/DNA-binding CsgD family transcriptional regulator
MFKKVLFIILCSSVFFPLLAQNKSLESAINEAKNKKYDPKIISEIEYLIQNSKDEKLNLDAFFVLGDAYKYLEVYDKAYNFYEKGLQLAEKNKLTKDIGLINENLGSIQFQLGNYDKSFELYSNSKKCFQKVNFLDGIDRVKGNIALLDIKTGHKQRAIQSLIQMKNDPKMDLLTKATTYLTLGNIYLEASEIQPAIDYYLQSLSLMKDTKKDKFKVLIYQNLAESYLALKQYDQAFFYNHESDVLLQKINSNELKSSLYLFYSKIYQGKLEYKKAYENLLLHQKFEVLADDSKNVLKIETIETLNKIESQKRDLQIKEQKIKLLKSEEFVAGVKIFCLVLILIGVLVLLFYLIKKQRNKVKSLSHTIVQTEDKLEFSYTKTEKMVLNIVKNNDFIERFKQSLKQIQTKTNDTESKTELNNLIFELQNFKFINDTKEDVFNQVDDQFTYKLEKKYPSLSDEERKICILIYLNLKNKDIAVLLNLSVRSVENSRYRIRKKLNLESNDSLSTILLNL